MNCEKWLTDDEMRDYDNICIECDIITLTKDLAKHMREARITFEEVIRKLISEVDR